MKIRLTNTLVIDSRHGLIEGTELATVPQPEDAHPKLKAIANHWVVAPESGETVAIFDDEYELVTE